MNRRKLVVRRFGVLSFGLGYFEDGIWIDHLAAPAGDTDGPEMAAIHAWLDCCGDRPGDRPAAIAVEARDGTAREPVAAAGRSATS
jgi:hypothetical protein